MPVIIVANAGVRTRHKDYEKYSRKWKRVRDVAAGQDEVHAGGAKYLPMLKDEDGGEYLARIERTPFYNASWRTFASFVGMLFRKSPTLEVPKQLEKLLEDVTMSGISFVNFAQNITLENIMISRLGVLVDYPVAVNMADGKPLNMKQAQYMGLRPSMVMYKAEAILNWRYDFVNNATVLGQVRLLEISAEAKNEFEIEETSIIRVLDLFEGKYRVRRFKEDNGDQIGWEIYPTMNGQPLNFIPFYFIGPDGTESELTEPVLIDLVDLNIKHYQVSADYENGCHMTALPTPVITGVAPVFNDAGAAIPPVYYIGSTTAWVFPNADAKASFLEFTGQGLSEVRENLKGKKEEMASIGARMLTPDKAGVEAEGTLAMRNAGEHSILGAISIAVSEGLTKALKTFADWAGSPSDKIKFEINRDFMPFALSPQLLGTLLSAVQAGKMSFEAFFDILKRGDLHEADTTFAIEQARVDAAPAMPLPIAAPGAKPGAKPGEPLEDDEDE